MRHIARFLALVAGLAAGCDGPPMVPPPRPPPAALPVAAVTKSALLPSPPHQKDPWSAPATSIPEPWLGAIKTLFEQGLGDPRGCEYREIEVAAGNVWSGGGEKEKTHGWTFAVAGETYALALSGLVYRPASVGAAASFAADLRAAIERDAAERKANPGQGRLGTAIREPAAISHEGLSPISAALALRLGEGALADEAHRAWTAALSQGEGREPYPILADFWSWALFDRAVTAHMRGDDPLALASVEQLAALLPSLEAECDRRGIERRLGNDRRPRPHFDWADPVQDLLADQRRRASSSRKSPSAEDLAALAPAARVTALVEQLDQVAARQWGQPGGVSLGEDPIVSGLVAAGKDAVEPLLAVLESDTRLTRSVHFFRDFHPHRSILGVHEAALSALSGILEETFFLPEATGDDLSARGAEGRKRVAKAVRAYWLKWRDLTIEERWYAMLADPAAKPQAWLNAALYLAAPTNVRFLPGTTTMVTTYGPGTDPKLRGEVLRAKKSPSVSDLFEARIEGLAADAQAACQLAASFALWDPARSLATLEKQMARAIHEWNRAPDAELTGECIAHLTTVRTELEDATALKQYSKWIVTVDPTRHGSSILRYVEPMWRFAKDPDVVQASIAMFRPGSRFVPLVALKNDPNTSQPDLDDLIQTPLIRVQGFRDHLVKELGNKTVLGKTTAGDVDNVSIDFNNGRYSSRSTGHGGEKRDPLMPKQGTVTPTRVADYYAYLLGLNRGPEARMLLAYLEGPANPPKSPPPLGPAAPELQLYWPLAKRDAAIAEAIKFLKALK